MKGIAPFLAGICAAGLAGCEWPKLDPDPLALTASSPDPAAAPNCASCHPYPLPDVHHQFHVMGSSSNLHNVSLPSRNGPITCMDCHFHSIKHFTYAYPDSIWADADGNEHRSPAAEGDTLVRVDVYQRFKPFLANTRPETEGTALAASIDSQVIRAASTGALVQFMTDWAHNDQHEQLDFAPNNVTPPEKLTLAFRPEDLSCSSIACHNRPERLYRWASRERGLSGCPSLYGHDPTCGEPP